MGKPRISLDPVADLRRRLARLRGSSIATLRACVRTWWTDHDFDLCPATVGKRIAAFLIEQRRSEDKLAGIAILESLELRTSDLPGLARLFEDGHLAEATVVDWFARKVLAAMLARTPEATSALARWRDAETAWQRRAACLAFADADIEIALAICATLVWSHEAPDQTAVGAVLRAISRRAPVRVVAFVRRHARLMSRACVRAAVARLPQRAELLAHHKRATTLRR